MSLELYMFTICYNPGRLKVHFQDHDPWVKRGGKKQANKNFLKEETGQLQ